MANHVEKMKNEKQWGYRNPAGICGITLDLGDISTDGDSHDHENGNEMQTGHVWWSVGFRCS